MNVKEQYKKLCEFIYNKLLNSKCKQEFHIKIIRHAKIGAGQSGVFFFRES